MDVLAQMVASGYCEQRGKALLRHGQALAANNQFAQALHFLTRAAEDEDVAPLARILTAQVFRLCARLCVRLFFFFCVWWEVADVGGEGGGSCLHPPPAPLPRASTLDMSEARFVEVEAGGQLQTCQCRSRLKLSTFSSRSRL
jgi:hypothetical protein